MSDCPICGGDSGHINNHVRMSAGDGHGPQGTYPDGWDTDAGTFEETGDAETPVPDADQGDDPDGEPVEQADAPEPEAATSDVDLSGDDRGDEPEPDDDLSELLFGDDEEDASEYECGECAEPLPYLGGDDRDEGGKECPNCGEQLFWSQL